MQDPPKSKRRREITSDSFRIGKSDGCNRPVLWTAGSFSQAAKQGFAGIFGGHEVISETYNIDYMEDMEKYGWNKNSAPILSEIEMEMLHGKENP